MIFCYLPSKYYPHLITDTEYHQPCRQSIQHKYWSVPIKFLNHHKILDPALSTLAGDFISRPTLCVTTRREDLTGLLNCTWSSCREGCTSDYFKCSHIYVNFVDIEKNENFTYPYNATYEELANYTIDIEKSTIESVLQVNIKGCGCKDKKKRFMNMGNGSGEIIPSFYYMSSFPFYTSFPDPPSVRCKNFTDTFGYEGK